MSSEQLFGVETQLVLPAGQLLVARITPQWQVEMGPKRLIDEKYSPEEALCLLALTRQIDKPMQVKELGDRIVETNEIAVEMGAEPNPLTNEKLIDDDFYHSVLETFGGLALNTNSDFRYNMMFIGAGKELRVWLLANIANIGYGERKLEDFFLANPGFKNLHKNYVAYFEREFNKFQFALRKETPGTALVEAEEIAVAIDKSQLGTASTSLRENPRLKVNAVDDRPKLREESAVPELGAKVRELSEVDTFSIDSIFPDNRIGVQALDRLNRGIDLLVDNGYITRISGSGRASKYRRTNKPF